MIIDPSLRAAARLLILLALAALFAAAIALGPRAGAAPSAPGGAAAIPDGEAPDAVFPPATRDARLAGRYAARIVRVLDGDTVEARILVWLGQEVAVRVRLRGLDAPEMRGACGGERALALAARDRLRDLAEGRAVELAEVGGDKYFGRVVASLTADGRDLGGVLLAEGLARPYEGGRRLSWCGFARPP